MDNLVYKQSWQDILQFHFSGDGKVLSSHAKAYLS